MAKWRYLPKSRHETLEDAEQHAKQVRASQLFKEVRVIAKKSMGGFQGSRTLETDYYYLKYKNKPNN